MTALGQNRQSQNLINPIRIEKVEPDVVPKGFSWSLVLDAVGILTAFFVGYSYFQFLAKAWPLLVFVGAFLVFGAVLAIEALLQARTWRQIGMLAIQSAAFLLPFLFFNRLILGASLVIMFAFLVLGHMSGRSELDHTMTIRFFRATHGVVANAMTGGLLVAILLYLPVANTGSVFVGESSFTGFFNWTAGILGGFYPAITFTGSFNDFAASLAKEQLAGNAAFTAMAPNDQATALSAATSQIEGSFAKSLGFVPAPAESLSSVIYTAVKNVIEGWRARFTIWFTAAWGVMLFLVLRSIGVVATWIGQLIAMIFYEALLSLGVIHIKQEPRTKEVVTF